MCLFTYYHCENWLCCAQQAYKWSEFQILLKESKSLFSSKIIMCESASFVMSAHSIQVLLFCVSAEFVGDLPGVPHRW